MSTNLDDMSIDDMAFAYLVDKLDFKTLSKRFGRTPSLEAVRQLASTLVMCDPDNKRACIWSGMERLEETKDNTKQSKFYDDKSYLDLDPTKDHRKGRFK
ncbi:MAG: hypothetical protein Unbinned4120contig1000_35 [Prokaryotic dsDNA virus sp.]|jgi:hypothetical protein|nr:MAG: hypothetical protein Unbinned4120contig1000_35 [Prokaryotic dsDNA virus sp.]|tara:strand:- start:31939 stop:32238 length:300 start_codon:yes stop_codon:yes gene_type:complete